MTYNICLLSQNRLIYEVIFNPIANKLVLLDSPKSPLFKECTSAKGENCV